MEKSIETMNLKNGDKNLPLDSSNQNILSKYRRQNILLLSTAILLICCFVGLIIYIAIEKTPNNSFDDIEKSFKDFSDYSASITDGDESSFVALLNSYLDSNTTEDSRESLEAYMVFLLLRSEYPSAALFQYLKVMKKLDALPMSELCRLYDYRSLIAKNVGEPSRDYEELRDNSCRAVPELSSAEATLFDATKLYNLGFVSKATKIILSDTLSDRSDEEKLPFLRILADYYISIGDYDNYYKTKNLITSLENPLTEDRYDGIRE